MLKLASEVIDQPSGVARVLTLLRYMGRAIIRIDCGSRASPNDSEMAPKLLTYLPKDGGGLMPSTVQEWIEEGIIAQRQTLLQLLHFRFPVTVEEDATYTAYFARIHTLNPLTELVNQLLSAPTLAVFEEKVLAYLPKEQG